MEIDRKAFLDSLGGAEGVKRMDDEGRADALESHMMSELNSAIAAKKSGEAPCQIETDRQQAEDKEHRNLHHAKDRKDRRQHGHRNGRRSPKQELERA